MRRAYSLIVHFRVADRREEMQREVWFEFEGEELPWHGDTHVAVPFLQETLQASLGVPVRIHGVFTGQGWPQFPGTRRSRCP